MHEDQPFTAFAFLGHIGRSICFAVPTGLSLWLLYSFAIKIVGRGCCPIFDLSTDSANMGWALIVNCFLAALNPMLFFLFIIWSFYRSLVEAHDYAVDKLIFLGLAPVIIYFIFAVKRGWVSHSSVVGEKPLQKLTITVIVCIAMLPLQKQILNAPSNIINSIKILTLSQHMSESGVPHREWLRARTFAKTLGEAGKHNEAMAALIESMDENLKGHHLGSLNEDLVTLKYIDQPNELTKDEWINLCKPLATRLNFACEKLNRFERNYQIDYPSITLLLKIAIGRYQSHGAFDEAMHYQNISNEINRIRRGDSPGLDSRTEATLAIAGNYPQKALAILQTSMARSECFYPIYSTAEDMASRYSHPFARMDEEIKLYEKTVTEFPTNSREKKDLALWRNNRELHEKAYFLLKHNDFAAAEPLLLQAQDFDVANKSSGRAWSIYQILLGSVELKLKKYPEAEKHYLLALEHDRSLKPGGPKAPT